MGCLFRTAAIVMGLVLLTGAGGGVWVTWSTTTTTSDWSNVIMSGLIIGILTLAGIGCLAIAATDYFEDDNSVYVSNVREAIQSIDMAERTYVQHNPVTPRDVADLRTPSSYTVVDSVIGGDKVSIRQNDQTGRFDMLINGKTAVPRGTSKAVARVLKQRYKIDKESVQRPLPPADGKKDDSFFDIF